MLEAATVRAGSLWPYVLKAVTVLLKGATVRARCDEALRRDEEEMRTSRCDLTIPLVRHAAPRLHP